MVKVDAVQSVLRQQSSSAAFEQYTSLFHRQAHELRERLGPLLLPAQEDAAGQGKGKGKPVILLDIEGTTTPLPFVTRVLYPASLAHLKEYCQTNWKAIYEQWYDVALKQCPSLPPKPPQGTETSLPDQQNVLCEAFIQHLRDLIHRNDKAVYLKQIQGHIWKTLYEKGVIQGHLFTDVVEALRLWADTQLVDVHIYSSGSIAAQKLLFRYSQVGDLSSYIKGYHDPSTVGAKNDAKSYVNIRRSIESARGTSDEFPIIFLSDSTAELRAAASAGCQIVLSIRPLNAKLGVEDLAELASPLLSLSSFSQLPHPPTESRQTHIQVPLRRPMSETVSPGFILCRLQDDVLVYQSNSDGRMERGGQLKSFL
jgi:enolase-phosphatase E1